MKIIVTVETGQTYKIHPTNALAGIEEGLVKINDITKTIPEDQKEIWEDILEEIGIDYVVYTYPEGDVKWYMPIEVFVAVTTDY